MAKPVLSFTQVTTTEDDAFELLAGAEVGRISAKHIYIIETSGNDALFSLDGGTTFTFLKGNTGVVLDDVSIVGAVQGKNNDAGSDVILSGKIW